MGADHENQIEKKGEIFNWLAILWERGFHHENPQGNGDFYIHGLIVSKFMES